jgi:hypothetical protein
MRYRLCLFSFFLVNISLAQEPSDALRFAMLGHGGTARAQAIGGAVSALGGDLSTALVNPAGLAFFKTYDLTLTPNFSFGNNKTNYLGSDAKGKFSSPEFGMAGLVLPKWGSNSGFWENFSFAIGMNKSINFNNTIRLNGVNTQSSYSEKYLEELINNNVTDPNDAAQNFPFGSSLAFNTFLLDTVAGLNNTIKGYRSLATPQTGINQELTVESKGNINDLFFSASANHLNKLFIGGTLVFSKLRFERNSSFKESDATKLKNNFNYFQVDEYLLTEGVGVGLRLGLIFKPVERLRLGFSFHTPTLYNMDDSYNTKITTDLEGYQGNGVLTQKSSDLNNGEDGQFQYDYVNPMRIMGGISYVINEAEDVNKQKGFISADIEYINYAKSKFRALGSLGNNNNGSTYLQQVNTAISEQFKSALNFRVGGELKFKTIMTRLGFNWMGNAYALESLKSSRMNISGGLGYRNMGYFIDLTYVHQINRDAVFPYRLDNGFYEAGDIRGAMGRILLTVGFKF